MWSISVRVSEEAKRNSSDARRRVVFDIPLETCPLRRRALNAVRAINKVACSSLKLIAVVFPRLNRGTVVVKPSDSFRKHLNLI